MREIFIDGHRIADDEKAHICVDIGHNWAGDMGKMLAMIDTAKEKGADSVKFQTRHPEHVYSRDEYNRTSDNPQWMNPVYGVHREMLEPTYVQWEQIFTHCRNIGITAFSTPFDFLSADLLHSLDVPAFKIASGDATNIPLIEYVAAFGKPMIISTGGCEIEDVDRIVAAMEPTETPFALLQCSCIYPAPDEVLNVRVVLQYMAHYPNVVTGLSTHNYEIAPTLAAFTLGGRIFEHHYTNDRDWKGTDNHFSLTPDMLQQLRNGLDSIHDALGDGRKRQFPIEEAYTTERRKSLYWKKSLSEGDTVTREDIAILCPGSGDFQPYDLDRVVGSTVTGEVAHGDAVQRADVTQGAVV
jgi:sialic acid synthase